MRAALGTRVLRLEHVGSTSVPGLAAKPIIDMLLVIADPAEEAAYVPALEAAGYVLRIREPDWHQHRALVRRTDLGHGYDVNLHVHPPGSEEIDCELTFRDWLRTHPEDRARYEAAKRTLAAREWKYVQNYADAKTEVIEAVLARARRGQERIARRQAVAETVRKRATAVKAAWALQRVPAGAPMFATLSGRIQPSRELSRIKCLFEHAICPQTDT